MTVSAEYVDAASHYHDALVERCRNHSGLCAADAACWRTVLLPAAGHRGPAAIRAAISAAAIRPAAISAATICAAAICRAGAPRSRRRLYRVYLQRRADAFRPCGESAALRPGTAGLCAGAAVWPAGAGDSGLASAATARGRSALPETGGRVRGPRAARHDRDQY